MWGATVGDLYDSCTDWYGDRQALLFGHRSVSYRELREGAYRLARGLRAAGIRKGDRVAFLMANCPEYVFCEYALAKLGAIRVPLAVALGQDDHVYMINHSGASTLIYHERLGQRVASMIDRLDAVERFVLVAEDAHAVPDGHLHLQTLLENGGPDSPVSDVAASDLVGIYYTGGTTGRPKGVMLSHRAWVNSVLLEMLELGLGRDELFAYTTPLTHAAGVLLLPVLMRRGTGLILDGFDPDVFLAETERRGVTASMFVPTMLYVLLDHPGLGSHDTSSLRTILYGAAPTAPDRLKQGLERFGPVFAQFYGQTEAPMVLTALAKEEHVIEDPGREREILSSCGRPTVTTDIVLLDPEGSEVPIGEVGEICARSINLMDGYYRNPEATEETLRDGWLHTGDLARRDEEGFLYIVDRAKDMIISGGYNVYPREVEDVLFEHPAVKAAAVVGVPDPKWGEAVKAIVTLEAGASPTEEELIAWVKERKGGVQAPKSVEVWDEIPVTPLGKLDRKRIRVHYWEGRDRAI